MKEVSGQNKWQWKKIIPRERKSGGEQDEDSWSKTDIQESINVFLSVG